MRVSKTSGKIKGVGPDEPIQVHPNGAMEAKMSYGFHLLDAKAMFALAEVMHQGARKYARDNWRGIPVESHINHLLQHIFAFMAGDTQDDHLEHALARAMMALAVHLTEKEADVDHGPEEGISRSFAAGEHRSQQGAEPVYLDGLVWSTSEPAGR